MNRRWVVSAVMAAVLAIAVPGAGAAAERGDGVVKIGTVDIQRIMRESKVVQKMRESFQQEVQVKRETLFAREKEVKKIEEEIKNAGAGIPPEAMKGKREALEKGARDLTRLRDDLTGELKKKNNELTRKAIAEIMAIAKNYVQKENYAVILEKNAVVAAHASIDVTDAIIKLYDEKK